MKNIVVVEDDALSRRLMVDLLTVQGFDVRAYSNAEDAIATINGTNTDLVLMDIRLPGIDGFTALERLRGRSDTRSLAIIAVTASVMLGEQQKILRAGFDDYHAKPIQIPELLRQIDQHTTRSRGDIS
jgi:CheY-like chemotaxis protein